MHVAVLLHPRGKAPHGYEWFDYEIMKDKSLNKRDENTFRRLTGDARI